ncbi:MAG TPA: TA system VapC family ribonuclease toxin [Terriglobia bacterium]|nr:TA system VapC family ribonuclease toxin [Terriglobia bacterium]
MSALVDTNILLYSANPASPEHSAARAAIEGLRRGGSPWFLTWGVVYEFLRAATHPVVFTRPLTLAAAVSFIGHLLESPSVEVLRETEAHFSQLEEVTRQTPGIHGNDVHDAHLVVLMREHKVRTILTADKGFRRFRDIEVVDPVHA